MKWRIKFKIFKNIKSGSRNKQKQTNSNIWNKMQSFNNFNKAICGWINTYPIMMKNYSDFKINATIIKEKITKLSDSWWINSRWKPAITNKNLLVVINSSRSLLMLNNNLLIPMTSITSLIISNNIIIAMMHRVNSNIYKIITWMNVPIP